MSKKKDDKINILTLSAFDDAALLETLSWVCKESVQFTVWRDTANNCWSISYPRPYLEEQPVPKQDVPAPEDEPPAPQVA